MWFPILIGWTVLFFIFPLIAMSILVFAISTLMFYLMCSALRGGVARIAYGLRGFAFERGQQPLAFWLCILLYICTWIAGFGLVIFGIIKNFRHLFVGYF